MASGPVGEGQQRPAEAGPPTGLVRGEGTRSPGGESSAALRMAPSVAAWPSPYFQYATVPRVSVCCDRAWLAAPFRGKKALLAKSDRHSSRAVRLCPKRCS